MERQSLPKLEIFASSGCDRVSLMRRQVVLFAALLLTCDCSFAADKIPISDLPIHAIEESQITLPGSRPFHLKAKVVEATSQENDGYKAEIEEYWAAPDKWRRTVKASDFSQTIVVNGEKANEQLDGNYYPHWLRTIVNAIFELGAPLRGLDISKSSDNPMIGGTEFCRRFAIRAGIPPIGNNVFSTYCFEGDLLKSIGAPGYEAEYKDYKKFDGKQVARNIREYIEPGTELEATIYDLSVLGSPDESLFAVQQPSNRLQTVIVSEQTVQGLSLDTPALQWPLIQDGKSSGVLSIYVCIDREGQVREIYGLNSDHPIMTDAAREQVMKWRFKPASNGGVSVQVETVLTFSYETRIAPASEGGK
jgi:hypothetical protein